MSDNLTNQVFRHHGIAAIGLCVAASRQSAHHDNSAIGLPVAAAGKWTMVQAGICPAASGASPWLARGLCLVEQTGAQFLVIPGKREAGAER